MTKAVRCILCGGDHSPRPGLCSDDGMQNEIERQGASTWNRIAAAAQRHANHELATELKKLGVEP